MGPPRRGGYGIALKLAAWGLVCSMLSPAVLAEDDEGELINFAFATWMGTGVYTVGDRDAAILNLPIYVPWREESEEQWGIDIRLPVSLGVVDFDALPENLETIAFVPGVEVKIPVSDHWRIKPFAQIGYGKDFTSGESASIYGIGIKGLGVYPLDGVTLSVGGGALFAGSDPSGEGDSHGFSKFDLGLDLRFRAPFRIRERPTDVSVFVIGSHFVNDLDFPLPDDENEELKRLLEVGVSIGTDPQFRWWRFDAPRVGLSYLTGDGFDGLRLNLGFPF